MTETHRREWDINLNLRVRGLSPSSTVAINDRSNALLREGKDVFKLGLGQSPFPVPDPVVDALRVHAGEKDYLPVNGLWELREAIAVHHVRTFGFECNADNVLIGPGSKELMFLLQLCYYGDLVIPTPTWVSYAPQAGIIGRHIYPLPTTPENDWQPTPDQIEALCHTDPHRPRLLILTYPSNPTGKTIRRDRLKELAEVARKNRIIVLSDEIYGKLAHDGIHESITSYYPEGTIFSGGLSKWCGAGGWRLGLFVFPDSLAWLQRAMSSVGTETFTSTSAPIQYAAITAFEEGPEVDNYLLHSRRVLSALGRKLSDRLSAAGADLVRPDGAFYLFPDFSPMREKLSARGIATSADFCEQLLEDTGVAVLPGQDFHRPPTELTARLAYVDFDGGAALEASKEVPLDRDLDDGFIEANCGRMLEAVSRIESWLAG